MAKKENKKIPKPKIPKNTIPEQELPIKSSNGFVFCSIYQKWIKGTDSFYKKSGFTNLLVDSNEFSKKITEVVTEVIPKLFQDWKLLFNQQSRNPHCHPIPLKKIELVTQIAEEIQETNLNYEDLSSAGMQWWYIGFKNDLRLVGLYDGNENTFYPMFLDHHHLIHPDKNYNQPDYGNFTYCPIDSYKK